MRIIAGSARGTGLKSPAGLNTRPTADRVRESLFSVLASRGCIVDSRVLDIFAGTGALALEALSRGAAAAVAIDRATDRIIRENAARTHLAERLTVRRGDALRELSRLAAQGEKFDLVFCDPPYRQGLWEAALAFIDGSDILAADGLVLVEAGHDETALPALKKLSLIRTLIYGKTTRIYIFSPSEKEGVAA